MNYEQWEGRLDGEISKQASRPTHGLLCAESGCNTAAARLKTNERWNLGGNFGMLHAYVLEIGSRGSNQRVRETVQRTAAEVIDRVLLTAPLNRQSKH